MPHAHAHAKTRTQAKSRTTTTAPPGGGRWLVPVNLTVAPKAGKKSGHVARHAHGPRNAPREGFVQRTKDYVKSKQSNAAKNAPTTATTAGVLAATTLVGGIAMLAGAPTAIVAAVPLVGGLAGALISKPGTKTQAAWLGGAGAGIALGVLGGLQKLVEIRLERQARAKQAEKEKQAQLEAETTPGRAADEAPDDVRAAIHEARMRSANGVNGHAYAGVPPGEG